MVGPTHPHLVESRTSLNAAIDFMMCCYQAGADAHPDRAECWSSAGKELRMAHLEVNRLLEDPDRVEWETLIKVVAVAAALRRASTLIVCRRFSPLVTSIAMFTLPARVDWNSVLAGRMTEPNFSSLSRQASWLNKAPWACLDVRTSTPRRHVYGQDFARLIRQRQVRLIVLDHAPDSNDLRILRRVVRRFDLSLLCPRSSGVEDHRSG